MTKTISWKLSSGKTIEITMSHASTMTDDIAYADGDNINLGRKPYQCGTMTIKIDGIKVASDRLNEYTAAKVISGYTLEHNPQYAGMYKIANTKVLTTKENADLFNQAAAEVIEGGKSGEYKAYRVTEDAKTAAQAVEWANNIIAKAAKQDRLFTDAEIEVMATIYNNLYNEGGDGYVPTWVSREQYDKAQHIING